MLDRLAALVTIWNALAAGGSLLLAAMLTAAAAALPQVPTWLLPFLFVGLWLLGLSVLLLVIQRSGRETAATSVKPTPEPGPLQGAHIEHSSIVFQVMAQGSTGRIDISASSNTVAVTPDYDALLFPRGTIVSRSVEEHLTISDKVDAKVIRGADRKD